MSQYSWKYFARSGWISQYHHSCEHAHFSKKYFSLWPSYQSQVDPIQKRTVFLTYHFGRPQKLVCRNLSSGHPQLDPKHASRRKKLTFATYLSVAIGVVLLSATGLRFYGRMKRRAAGVEDLQLEEYSFGRRSWLYKYRGFVFPNMFFHQIRDIHTFDVREDDIWVVTYPKSGTTWVQEIVYLLMNDLDTEKASRTNISLRFPYFEFMEPGLKTIAEMPSPRLIKSHLPLSILPNQIKSKKPKMIYIVRNPKDVVVSYYSFAMKFLNVVPFNGSFEDYCQLFVSDKVDYGPWWKHVSEAWQRKDDDNVLVLFYEDLHLDTHKQVKEIANFLGKSVTDKEVDVIVKYCSFENMKLNNSVNYEWMKDAGVANKKVQFMRQGKVGDWKNYLSADITKQLDEMMATKLPPDLFERITDSLLED
ncbi:hypothetical protein EGW08_021820 [Elysia chlorotica]|uniref:Sulfotransferase domain-containing protein n=1 Tax=Elysia chlorotica TaxID=188477 RepID=A0A433SMN7_ELYCH|nr:hypothetical protein EGW08_021820 [Elysia chlorotica]